MDINVRDNFTLRWKNYFNNAELPITFYYTDHPSDAAIASHSDGWRCLICSLSKVRKGKSLAFDSDALQCGGAKRYLGFTDKMRPNFESFLITDSWKDVRRRIN